MFWERSWDLKQVLNQSQRVSVAEQRECVFLIVVLEPVFCYICSFSCLPPPPSPQHGQFEQSHFNLAHLRNLNALQRLLHTSRTRHLSELPQPQVGVGASRIFPGGGGRLFHSASANDAEDQFILLLLLLLIRHQDQT